MMRLLLLSILSVAPLVAADVKVVVSPGTGAPLWSSFNGFSQEKDGLTAAGAPNYNETPTLNLSMMLGNPVVRFGGDTTDKVSWDANGPAGEGRDIMTCADVANAAYFTKQAGNQVIWGLSMRVGLPPLKSEPTDDQLEALGKQDASEAECVMANFGSALIGFEIGNEPGLYAANGLRPSGYSPTIYEHEASIIRAQISASVTGAKFVGPADLTYAVPFVQASGASVALITSHYYAKNAGTIPEILSGSGYLTGTVLPKLKKAVSAYDGLTYRIGECNSFSSTNQPGFDFGTALWAIDFEFNVADFGGAGVNYENNYPAFSQDTETGVVKEIYPLYYAMKLLSGAFKGGTLAKVSASGAPSSFSAHAVIGNETYVVLNNKDASRTVDATISLPSPATSAQVMVLKDNGGVTYGGAPVTKAGTWAGKFTPVEVVDGEVTLAVAPYTAVLVEMQ